MSNIIRVISLVFKLTFHLKSVQYLNAFCDRVILGKSFKRAFPWFPYIPGPFNLGRVASDSS